MRKFDYRAPRFAIDLPVRLTIDNAIYIGRCNEISTEGMKLELDQSFETGCTGIVRLNEKGIIIDLPVRICYSNSDHTGLKFLYESDAQRDEIVRVVSLCTGVCFDTSHFAVD
jgi:hypothetical protein